MKIEKQGTFLVIKPIETSENYSFVVEKYYDGYRPDGCHSYWQEMIRGSIDFDSDDGYVASIWELLFFLGVEDRSLYEFKDYLRRLLSEEDENDEE